MGLPEADFWRLTPRQFSKYIDRLDERLQRDCIPSAIAASAMVNAFGGKTSPKDFIPGANKPRRLSGDEAAAFFKAFGA